MSKKRFDALESVQDTLWQFWLVTSPSWCGVRAGGRLRSHATGSLYSVEGTFCNYCEYSVLVNRMSKKRFMRVFKARPSSSISPYPWECSSSSACSSPSCWTPWFSPSIRSPLYPCPCALPWGLRCACRFRTWPTCATHSKKLRELSSWWQRLPSSEAVRFVEKSVRLVG